MLDIKDTDGTAFRWKEADYAEKCKDEWAGARYPGQRFITVVPFQKLLMSLSM